MPNAAEKRQAAAKSAAKAGAAGATPTTGDDGKKPVAQQIREMAETGATRKQIADHFGVSYQRVYQITRGMTVYENSESGGGQRPRVVVEANEELTKAGLEDLVGRPRVEVIRELYAKFEAAGEEKFLGKIAKLLGCTYQIVFQATKSQRAGASDEELEDGEDLEVEDVEGEDEEESDEEEEEDEEDE